MALANGFECPQCGDTRQKDVVHFHSDYHFNVQCPGCEHIWTVDQREREQCPCCRGHGALRIRVEREEVGRIFVFDTPCGICGGEGTIAPEVSGK